MTTRKLTIKDLQLNVSICGTGSPLLLLNGLGGLIRSFDLLREELADYTTIALDVPGIGKSQTPRWPLRLSRHADLIAELLEQLGFEQVDVFGVSWGGAHALPAGGVEGRTSTRGARRKHAAAAARIGEKTRRRQLRLSALSHSLSPSPGSWGTPPCAPGPA